MVSSKILDEFHPVLRSWFCKKFGQPAPVQEEAWSQIMKGDHTLIASPTGSGKTLAALLPCLDRIVKENEAATMSKHNGVRALYITPLKALNNDIQHHIVQYIEEMEQIAAELGIDWPGIRVAVRTGDTSASTRASMLRNPPDLLITTPESLYILLTSPKARNILQSVQQVIVDEIHDLADNRRGTHLTITLERLVEWCGRPIQRTGVSATQKPLERIARFLGGWENDQPRPVTVVENRSDKQILLKVTMPKHHVISTDKENFWTPLVDQLVQQMIDCQTVLVFVNNRRLCERLALRLNEHVGYEFARSHHGSIAREKRLEVEQLLKSGALKCLVATSSLELGIDVGSIDLVIQIDSPKQAATGIQRIGRGGHQIGGVSRGIIVAKSRNELLEVAVLGRMITERDIEEIRIPRHSLDVISQQVVAMVACENWTLLRLYEVITRSDSYREFPLEKLEEMIKVLTGLYPFARPLIDKDTQSGEFIARKNTQMAALMGAGTIPQSSNYPVHHLESRIHLGELEEAYVYESRVGDVFQLGATSWKIQSISNHRVYVTETTNRFSEIPFWQGETNGRSFALGRNIGCFLDEVAERVRSTSKEQLTEWLETEYFLDAAAATELIHMVQQQMQTSHVPSHRTLVIEYYMDEIQHTHLMIHSLYGRRFNRTWMLALQHVFSKRGSGQCYGYAKDNGIEFIFTEWDPHNLTWIYEVTVHNLESILEEMIPSLPQFGMTFRRMAEMSLLLTRSFKRTPIALKRHRSEELLRASLPYADQFPLIRESMHECLHEHMELPHLQQILQAIQQGEVRVVLKESRYPSAFARMLMSDFMEGKIYEGESVGRDLQMQLLSLNKDLAVEWFGPNTLAQAITPEAIVAEEDRLTSSTVGNAEELYRLLKKQGDLSQLEIEQRWGVPSNLWLEQLVEQKQVIPWTISGQERWICYDEEDVYARFPDDELAAFFVLSRYMESHLSFTTTELAVRYGLTADQVKAFIEQCKEKSLVEKVPFGRQQAETAWMSTSILSRLIRSSVRSFHQESEAVGSEQLFRAMMTLHNVTSETRRTGVDGLRQVIEHMQGMFIPLSQWETVIFPSRVRGYRKEDLDQLCASGEVIWIGKQRNVEKEGRIAFFLTEAKELYRPYIRMDKTVHPHLLQLLQQKGALYLSGIARELDLPPSQALEMLLELAWEGHVSNDQFAPLRQHALRQRKTTRSAHSGFGRWYRLDSIVETNTTVHEQASMMSWIQQLLKRNGIVCKSALDEECPYNWDVMLESVKQLESWGMVLRGWFVRDIASLQFSTKEFIEKMRTQNKANFNFLTDEHDQQVTFLAATDPANLYGLMASWPEVEGVTFSRKPGNYMVIYRGQWVLWIENKGKRITMLNEDILQFNPVFITNMLREIFRQLLNLGGIRKISIDLWNGQPVWQSTAIPWLEMVGAEKDQDSAVIWSSMLK